MSGVPYLQKVAQSDAEKKVEEATDMVFGQLHRVIFSAVVNNAEKEKPTELTLSLAPAPR